MPIRKIIGIGGGEIGRKGYQIETTSIDKEIIRLSGKKHPKFLFIPTASKDSKTYIDLAKKHFSVRLGCYFDSLCVVKEFLSQRVIARKILGADIIYVGGGNTMKMMQIWRRFGIDKLLRQAYNRGKVMSGLSAGAICWFRYGLSDSRLFQKGKSKDYMRVRGLGLVNLTVSPHHLREQSRRVGLINLMKKTPGVAVALDDFSALEIINDKFRVITSKNKSGAHKVFKKKERVYYESICKSTDFKELITLIRK